MAADPILHIKPILDITGLTAGYGAGQVLRGVDLTAAAGQITCVMGRNGAGKTTLIKAIMGLLPGAKGSVRLAGQELIDRPAHLVPGAGLAWVPQGRRLFTDMTVAENLDVGGYLRGNARATRDHVLTLFPRLGERLGQEAGTLSGGEQQMLAIARALCLEPKVLLLDEPTEGLQPSVVAQIRDVVAQLKADGVAVVLVEQRVEAVLAMADRVAFMAQGRVMALRDKGDLAPGAAEFRDFVGV